MLRQEIEQKIRTSGILPTAQRMEVAELLLIRPQHMSADQVIHGLRLAGSRVSKATVYNTLNLFTKCGLVKEINVAESRKFYDSTTHPHHHFYHVETGELTDIPAASVEILNLPPLPAGTEEDGVEVLVRVRSKRP